MAVVIDASVAMGWFVASQATPISRAALVAVNRESGVVPAHFGIEMARALRNRERRRLMSAEAVDGSLAELCRLRLNQDSVTTLDIIDQIVELARAQQLRVADAVYLELALRLKVPLATADAALARSAAQAGVNLITA